MNANVASGRRDVRLLWIAVIIGLAARLALVATSIGTNDVPFMILWAKFARESGIAHAYARQWELNHPPLSLLIIHWLDVASVWTRIELTDLIRLFQVAADMVTTAILVAISRVRKAGSNAAVLFVLSPAAIAISGFHCNTDPTMIAFLMLAVLLLLRERALAAGIVFAASVGIKIIPIFVLPFLLLVKRELRTRFIIAAAIGLCSIFGPVVAIGGRPVLRNIFAYSGFAGKWGIPALLTSIERLIANPRTTLLYEAAHWYAAHGRYVVALAVVVLFLAILRRAQMVPAENGDAFLPVSLLPIVPAVMLLILALAPGFGIQYLVWPLPLLPYAVGRRMLIVLSTTISFYVVMTYTIWSRGFPWWYADSIAPSSAKPLVTSVGLIIWAFIGIGVVDALRRLRAP